MTLKEALYMYLEGTNMAREYQLARDARIQILHRMAEFSTDRCYRLTDS